MEIPFSIPALIKDEVHTISVSFTVKSSSLDIGESLIITDGRIHTGGAGKYLQMYISGLPPLAESIPSSSQSSGLTCLNKLSTFKGFRSSTDLLMNFSKSGAASTAASRSLSHSPFSYVGFFPM
ncbi:hypothetical protein WICPIJ_007739 [Wickerhamomyces pijperi]|uniref:Uncharacterized protein n=1 Tax=Wickerhamomyces pijperi TaxID=599730 RepID=A0A9P8Q183_WICPI|nr:hypothetical protein WICPIJ_007739 [Wickerhamomyces pijperi]